MSYRDYGIPVFALYKENEINNLIKVGGQFLPCVVFLFTWQCFHPDSY
jgi:hypothetical protein